MKAKFKNALLIAVSISLPLLLGDLVLRALQLPRSSARTMLLAGGSLYSDPRGYRRYDSHRDLEQSAVYGRSIAYRYQSRSNNLGLISTPDIQPGQTIDFAIAGDSFAEGQGGYPWVSELQREWLQKRGLLSINYAIAGSGFEDFAITARVAKEQHKANRILILFIEHDAYRPYQTMASHQSCSFYSNGSLDQLLGPFTCGLYGIVWHHIPPALSDPELVSASLDRQAYGVVPALSQLLQTIGTRTRRPESNQSSTSQSHGPQRLRFGALPQASLDAISDIRTLYGSKGVLMVQLPDRPAAAIAAQKESRELFQKELRRRTGLNVLDLAATCQLRPEDFHRLDPHPNRSGYASLAACVRHNPAIRSFIAAGKS